MTAELPLLSAAGREGDRQGEARDGGGRKLMFGNNPLPTCG